jgi:hypothetical protein
MLTGKDWKDFQSCFYLHLQDVGNRVTLWTMFALCPHYVPIHLFMVYWDALEHNLGPNMTPIWDADLGPQFGTPIWDPNLGPQFGTPIWDPNLGPQFGTPIWDLNL